MIQNDEAILPDKGISNIKEEGDFYTKSITPRIDFISPSGRILESLNFRTEHILHSPNKENLIQLIKDNFISYEKENGNADDYSNEMKNYKYYVSVPLYIDEEKIDTMIKYYSGMYVTEDKVKLGQKSYFPTLRKICEYCSYTL